MQCFLHKMKAEIQKANKMFLLLSYDVENSSLFFSKKRRKSRILRDYTSSFFVERAACSATRKIAPYSRVLNNKNEDIVQSSMRMEVNLF